VLLVTSALHMPAPLPVFSAAPGLTVDPGGLRLHPAEP